MTARVLIVDDSALIRSILKRGLGADPRIEVVGTAVDPYDARDQIAQLRPNVLTLDIEMPRMMGLEFLRRLMAQHPIPTVVFSTLSHARTQAAVDALASGATEVIGKPSSDVSLKLDDLMQSLRDAVVRSSRARVQKIPYLTPPKQRSKAVLRSGTDHVIAVGSSTGGPAALMAFLRNLPADAPGVVVTQHMPVGFTAPLAKRLSHETGLDVKEAIPAGRIVPGTVWIAPGSHHLRILRNGGVFETRLDSGPIVSGHRPSVDVLFKSVADAAGSRAVGVLLTGMGRDGAEGLKQIRNAGGHTLAQSEATCVVYGMPKAAVELGAVEESWPPKRLAERANALSRAVVPA